ncbi:ankyrin protein 3 [Fusarium bulbicola]|nr:ankyrin protein 3 [Fusarium bulbicola]
MVFAREHGQGHKRKRQQKGSGDKAGRDGTDSEDSETGKATVPRYPQSYKPPQMFSCPFEKYDQARYADCRGCRLSRISDVMQHIRRRHVLTDNVPESHPNITLDNIWVYCTWCRQEFQGQDAEKRLHDHTLACKASERPATIEETGVLVPKEFYDLKSEVMWASGPAARWEAIWQKCFPMTPPPSPYVEIAIRRAEVQRILHQLLNSPAANPWSSADIRQSWIDKALAAIYSGLPFTESEPQINDASTILSANLSTVLTSGESILDDPNNGSSTAPESCVDLGDMHEWTLPLKTAILDVDHDRVHGILRNSFDKVAVGEYSWLLELKALGLSMDEIADELLERAQQGPWIHSEIDEPCVENFQHDFHISTCLHSWKTDEAMPTASRQPSQALAIYEADSDNSVRETIGYLCGIGGVRPMPDGSYSLQFGSVVFENANSTAIASLKNSGPSHAFEYVLQNLKKAIGGLQEVGGCCDSFSFLARRESFVQLEEICASSVFEPVAALISLANSEDSLEALHPHLLDSLAAQFLSLAFALYAQGHCEPFSPFFLDTPLKRILLIGNQIWGSSFAGPCILATPVDLSCLGEMVQRRVFAFQYFNSFERLRVFLDCDRKFDLRAYPEDSLDTWGPGDFLIPKDDAENLHAISIGGGLITSVPTETESHEFPVLHWSPISENNNKVTSTFPRYEKMVIGSRVSINQDCRMIPQEQVRKSIPWLKDLGTFPSYWEVSERQLGLGLQGGQSAVAILNFSQTWVKRLGQTKKSNILAKRSLSIADLEGPSAVQVSFCTGIARRVQLRELLADVLPAYVEDLATKPRYWEKLQGCDILEILRHEDFRTHYQRLDRELQAEF